MWKSIDFRPRTVGGVDYCLSPDIFLLAFELGLRIMPALVKGLREVNAFGACLSGVLPEEGSPPPSSTPDIKIKRPLGTLPSGLFFVLIRLF